METFLNEYFYALNKENKYLKLWVYSTVWVSTTLKMKNALRKMLQNSNTETSIKPTVIFHLRNNGFLSTLEIPFSFGCIQGSGPSHIFSSFSNFHLIPEQPKILVYLQKTTNSQVYLRKLVSLNSRKNPEDQVIRANQSLFVSYAMKLPKLLTGKEHTHIYMQTLFLMNSIFFLFVK